MERADLYTAQFDVVSDGGRRRFTEGTELRERRPDGSIPPVAMLGEERYELDVEDDDGISVYLRWA